MGMMVGVSALLGFFGLRRRFGRHHGQGRGHGHWRQRARQYAEQGLERAFSRLDATPEQRERLRGIFDRVWTGGTQLQDEKKTLRDELYGQWKSEAPDGAQVHASLDARLEALKRFTHETADALLEVHRLLSPTQRATVNAFVDARMQRRCAG